jgi:hypothetical protein
MIEPNDELAGSSGAPDGMTIPSIPVIDGR